MRGLIGVVVVGVVLAGGPPVQATTRYVGKSGSNSNSCSTSTSASPSNAKLTLNGASGAVSCMSGGDTLLVHAGNYDEYLMNTSPSGVTPVPSGSSWGSPTTIKAAPGESVWIVQTENSLNLQGRVEFDAGVDAYIILDGINIDIAQLPAAGNAITSSSRFVRYQNAEIKNSTGSCILVTGDFTEFLNLNVHHCGLVSVYPAGAHGMYIEAQHVVIDNILLHDNLTNGVQFTCEGCGGNVQFSGITRSTIYNNGHTGIVLFPNNYAYNNVIYGHQAGIKLAGGAKAIHNTVFNNGDIGIWPSAGGDTVQNNISLGQAADIYNGGASGTIASNNICSSTSEPETVGCTNAGTTSALFVNWPTDMHLKATASAINAGLSGTGVAVDKDNVARPQGGGVDIGAYEFVVGGSPPVPQALRVGSIN